MPWRPASFGPGLSTMIGFSCEPPRLVQEGARIADAFDVKSDHLGARISCCEAEEIELVDIDLVANIDALAKPADAASAPLMTCSMTAPVKMPVCVNSDTPPGCHRGKLTKLPIIPHSVLTMPIVLGPARSRPELAAISRSRSSSSLGRPCWLRKAGRDDAGGARASCDALLYCVFDMLTRQNDVDEIDVLWHRRKRWIGLLSHDSGARSVDGVKRPAELAPDQDC